MVLMADASYISPPLTRQSPLGALSGWSLIIHCRFCGQRTKPVDEIAKTPAISAKPVGEIIDRLSCADCGQKPSMLEIECSWAKPYLQKKIIVDVSWLLTQQRAAQTAISG